MSNQSFGSEYKPEGYYNSFRDGYYSNLRKEMVNFVPQSANRILEVGCGIGVFGEFLKSTQRQIEIWGVEIVEAVAEEAKKVG